MNAKIRTLVWGELRVGGTVAAMCAGGGLCALLTLHLDPLVPTVPRGNAYPVVRGLPLVLHVVLVLSVLSLIPALSSRFHNPTPVEVKGVRR